MFHGVTHFLLGDCFSCSTLLDMCIISKMCCTEESLVRMPHGEHVYPLNFEVKCEH
jgi:hypothetical protein